MSGYRQDLWMANRLGQLAAEWERELTRTDGVSDEYLDMCAREAREYRAAQNNVIGRLQRQADEEARKIAAE